MKKILYRSVTGCLLLGWLFTIFWFSAQPAVESEKISGSVAFRMVDACNHMFHADMTEVDMERMAEYINYPIRKAAHMTEYAILGLLFFFCIVGYAKEKKRIYVAALCLTAVYAATDEIHQLFVEGRAGRVSDVCIDTIGALIGLVLLYLLRKFISAKRTGKHCEKQELPVQ